MLKGSGDTKMTSFFRMLVECFRFLAKPIFIEKVIMNSKERRQRILKQINHAGAVRPEQLAEQYQVSVQTIRSDLRTLGDKGLLIRRHGVVAPFPGRENVDFEQRQIRNAQGKARIAQRCLSLLAEHQSLLLGTGTTVEHLAAVLYQVSGLRIMTNNLHAARHLCHHPSCELLIAGGLVRKRDQDVVGGDSIEFFNRFNAEIGIVSVGCMDKLGHLYDYNTDEVMAREALLRNSRHHILLIDSSKFNSEGVCRAGHISDFHSVISDEALHSSLRSQLSAKQVDVLVG
ncbi:DeoR/GlpR family DNA-binding transcription regulator [Nitrincola alkalisediminis]